MGAASAVHPVVGWTFPTTSTYPVEGLESSQPPAQVQAMFAGKASAPSPIASGVPSASSRAAASEEDNAPTPPAPHAQASPRVPELSHPSHIEALGSERPAEPPDTGFPGVPSAPATPGPPTTTSLRAPSTPRPAPPSTTLTAVRAADEDSVAPAQVVRVEAGRTQAPPELQPLLPPRPPSRILPQPPAAAPAQGPSGVPQPTVEETTEVHVSIGRIEITAVHEAPPQRREPTRTRKPRSLEEYLATRRERPT